MYDLQKGTSKNKDLVMFSRIMKSVLLKRAQKIPVIAILGSRQSGKTIVNDFFKTLVFWSDLTKKSKKTAPGYFIYGGEKGQKREQATVISWQNTETIFNDTAQ